MSGDEVLVQCASGDFKSLTLPRVTSGATGLLVHGHRYTGCTPGVAWAEAAKFIALALHLDKKKRQDDTEVAAVVRFLEEQFPAPLYATKSKTVAEDLIKLVKGLGD